MTDSVPAIRIYDTYYQKSATPTVPPSPQWSEGQWDGDFRIPNRPASRRDTPAAGRRPTSPNLTSGPAKVLRSLSNNIISSNNGPSGSDKGGVGESEARNITADPLTQHIRERTGSIGLPSSPSGSIYHSAGEDDRADHGSVPSTQASPENTSGKEQPKKTKGVSFFGRIMGGGKKRERQSEIAPDNVSIADSQPEGHDAEIFSPTLEQGDFSHHPAHVPKYIRVRTRHSKRKHFDALFLAQELAVSTRAAAKMAQRPKHSASVNGPTATWALEFSKDGKFLAAAGDDKIVRVWAVIKTAEERQLETRRDSTASTDASNKTYNHTACVFQSKPIREFSGHSSTILDLSWSKNNFLVSSSMDKSVKLWHVTRSDCLCTFKHSDIVPTVAFHPKDDRSFLTGSLDSKLRLWSIAEKKVVSSAQVSAMITAVSFTPDGKHVIAGCSDGTCHFFEAEGLKYQTQLRVRSANNKHSKGAKITGIDTFQHTNGEIKILVTSNDSKVRLYNIRDKSLEIKLKGSVNSSSQIRASLSDDLRYICTGSEDNRAYIWPLCVEEGEDTSKQATEHFQAHDSTVTCVRLAPTRSRQLVARSDDPIFGLCNSRYADPSANALERKDSHDSSQHSINYADASSINSQLTRQKSEAPSMLSSSRCPHHAGNIVVTASANGAIKVFRQDCAARYRAPQGPGRRITSMTLSHNGSIRTKSSARSLRSASSQVPSDRIFSWRQAVTHTPSVRAGSISSKHSTRSLSPRKSSQARRSTSGPAPARFAGGQTSTNSQHTTPAGSKHNSPQILHSLKNTAFGGPSRRASSPQTGTQTPSTTFSVKKHANTLPIVGSSQEPSTNDRRQTTFYDAPLSASPDRAASPSSSTGTSPTTHSTHSPSTPTSQRSSIAISTAAAGSAHVDADTNPLMLQGDQSNLFWNVAAQRSFAERAHASGSIHDADRRADLAREKDRLRMMRLSTITSSRRPSAEEGISRQASVVSRLSIDAASSVGGDSAAGDPHANEAKGGQHSG